MFRQFSGYGEIGVDIPNMLAVWHHNVLAHEIYYHVHEVRQDNSRRSSLKVESLFEDAQKKDSLAVRIAIVRAFSPLTHSHDWN